MTTTEYEVINPADDSGAAGLEGDSEAANSAGAHEAIGLAADCEATILTGNIADEQLLELSKDGIDGSEATAIMGLPSTTSAYEVWGQKTGVLEPKGPAPDAARFDAMLEDVVEREFAYRHPEVKVERVDAMLRSCEHSFMHARLGRRIILDGIRPAILEVVLGTAFTEKDWRDGVPAYCRTRIAHYMAVTGWDTAYVAVLLGGCDYREYVLHAEDMRDEINAVINACEDFWYNNVVANVAPAMTGAAGEADALFRQYPSSDKTKSVKLPIDDRAIFDEYVEAYLAAKEKLDEAKQTCDALSNKLKAYVGENGSLESDKYSVKWSRTKRRTFDRASFDADHPGLYEKYQTSKTVNGAVKVSEL